MILSASDLSTVTWEAFDPSVLASHRVVLVLMGAPWCAPCRRALAILQQLALHRSDIRIVAVDLDENKALAKHYRITQIPTFMLFLDGEPVERLVGAMSFSAMNALLDRNR